MNAPNWATILSAISTTLGLLAAFAGALYAVRQYRLAVDRERRAQASKVAFWGEVDDDEMQMMYINTSGLPVWDVVVRPSSATSPEDRHEEFVLGPSDEAVSVGPVWGWAEGTESRLVDGNQQLLTNISVSAGRIADMTAITGGWKRLEGRTSASTVRLERARLRSEFTDAAGVRWTRSARGELAATNTEPPPPWIDRLRTFGRWIVEALRYGSSNHDSSRS